MKDSSRNKYDWHHIVSKSIGGPTIPENKYRWLKKKHQAYHQLFRNHLPSIVIKIIEEWIDEKGEINKKKISVKDFKAWKKVFGDIEPAEAIRFIEKTFLPIEKKYLRGELGR